MEAVDLVHLNTESPGPPTLEVNQFMLNEVLTNAKEGNAVVISIVGPLQSGKSFLMNLLIKNLHFAQQESDQDWLYQGGPLRGFRFEASSGVVTRGISVYRQPFKIRGRPVFVIDTRGVFEEETCLREWAGIVGTCLAISSCTIFNVQTLLHDDSLNYLDSFIQYSRILCSNVSRGDDEIKIENLMFLVRDWNNPSEFQYGAAGGQQFLMKKFSIEMAGMTEEAKRVRKSILASVRNISCFLMPHPGSSLSAVQYNQPIQPGSLLEFYESSMREFMSTLTQMDSIWNSPPSPIHRIAEFVQVFNSVLSQVLPTADITAQVNYEMNIYSGVKFYETTIRRKIEKKGRIRLRYVDEHHAPLKAMLLDRFRQRRHYGNAEMQEQYTLRLDQALESARLRIIEELVKQQEALAQQAKVEAISTACEQLKDLSVSETLSPSALESAWIKAKAAALSAHEKVLEKIEKEKRGGLQGNLEAALLEIYEDSRKKCQHRQQLLVDGHQEILKESVGKYDERMEIISGNYVPEAKFLKTHDVAMAVALKYFTSHMNIPDDAPEVKLEIEANFNQLIEHAKANFLKQNENILEEFNAQKQQILEQTLATFSEKVNEIMEQQAGLPQKLNQIKDERNDVSDKALEDVEQLDEATPPLVLAFRKELKAKLDEKVQDAKAMMDQKTAEQAEFAKQAIQGAIDKFQQTVQMLSEQIISPGACSQTLKTAKEHVIQSVSTSLSEINLPNLQFYLNHLNNQVEIMLTQAVKENNGKHQVMMETLKNISESSLKEFKDAAEDIISRAALGDTDAPSGLLKAENLALESFDSAVADCHFNHSETDLTREELRRALENSRESYLGRLEDRTIKNFDEIVLDLHEKALKALVEKMDAHCSRITIVAEADFHMQWERSKNAVALELEVELMRSNRVPTNVALDISDKVKQQLGSAEEAWQKQVKVNEANRQKIVESMNEFVSEFEGRIKDIERGASNAKRRLDSKKNSAMTDFRISFTCQVEEERSKLLKEFECKLNKVIEDFERGQPMDTSEAPASYNDTLLRDGPDNIIQNIVNHFENSCRVQQESMQGHTETSTYDIAKLDRLRSRLINEFQTASPWGKARVSADDIPRMMKNFDKEANLFRLKQHPYHDGCRAKLEQELREICENQPENNVQTPSQHENIPKKTRLSPADLNDVKEEALRAYKSSMDKHFTSPAYFQSQRLTEFHTEACNEARDQMLRKLDLEDGKEVQSMLDDAYKQYEAKNNMNTPTSYAIGIDLGTTYSCVGVYINNKVEIIPNERGVMTTPSFISFGAEGTTRPVCGDAAKEQAHLHPERTIYEVKRLIGRSMDDPAIAEDLKKWPFKVVNECGAAKVLVGEKTYHPEEISAMLLKKLKQDAEEYVGDEVKYAVITVPAYFSEAQRNATKNAGKEAGLEVLRIINEPTAAAIACNLNWTRAQRVVRGLVYDFGGGTFDVAVFEANKGQIAIKAVGGDTHLGGVDFDNAMVNHCIANFKQTEGKDLEKGRDIAATNRTKMRIKGMCERSKKNLSTAPETTVFSECIYGSTDLSVKIKRAEFEQMIDIYIKKSIECVVKTLEDAKLKKEDMEEIVLIGGSTRIPKVRMALSEFFGRPVNFDINPDEAVAVGAAYEAAVLNGARAQREGDIRSAAIAPLGMSIQDVTPMSLGIEIDGGDMSVLIPRQSQVPEEVSHTYLTAYHNQTSVQIVIWEGEEAKAVQNTQVAEFYLNGIPPAKAGVQRIKVTMKVDREGIITVTAVCVENGVEKKLTVRDNKKRLVKKDATKAKGA